MDYSITNLTRSQKLPWDLLFLADPSKNMINNYIDQSEIFTVKEQGLNIGVLVLKIEEESAEIMNLAVLEEFQGKGIGSKLINHAIETSKSKNLKKIIIATADTSKSQLRLYQNLGFTIVEQVKNYFIDNYKEPILENGKRARDMIRMEMSLS